MIMILVAHYFAGTIRYSLAAPLFSIILLAPYSNWYGWNVIFNSYYVPHICIALMAVSLFVRTFQVQKKGYRILYIVLSFILAFVGCLGGVWQLMICYGPLLLTALLYACHLHVRHCRGEQDRHQHALIILGYAAVLCAIGLCGYLVNQNILRRYFIFESQADLAWQEFDLNQILKCLGDLIALFGWRKGSKILHLAGIGSAMSIVLVFLLVGCTVYCLRKTDLDESDTLVLLFSVCCFTVLMFVYGLTDRYNESYWTLYLPFAFIGLLLFIKHWKLNLERVGITLFTVAILLVNSRKTELNPYISWVPNDLAIQNAAAWLQDNGYTQGVAQFWESDIVTALTNGKIEM